MLDNIYTIIQVLMLFFVIVHSLALMVKNIEALFFLSLILFILFSIYIILNVHLGNSSIEIYIVLAFLYFLQFMLCLAAKA